MKNVKQINISHNDDHTLVSTPSIPNFTLKFDNNGIVTKEVGGTPTGKFKCCSPRYELSLNDFADILEVELELVKRAIGIS